MYEIRFTPEALDDLRRYTKAERSQIASGIHSRLTHEPSRETRNRKKLRPNRVAEWELRVDRFRVFYDINDEQAFVKIEAVGHKDGNRLYLHGQEFQL